MGNFTLSYKRPRHVDQESFRQSFDSSAPDATPRSVRSGDSGYSGGIPNSLAFDNIIGGGTCPPMTVRDFMNYLKYIEHSAENLQFYLWHQDYVKRFHGAPASETALAPEWTQAMEDDAMAKLRKFNMEKLRSKPEASEMFKGTDFDTDVREIHPLETYNSNPFNTPPRTPHSTADRDSVLTGTHTTQSTFETAETAPYAAEAFEAAGVAQPFTIQPFREEINRVISTFIMEGAPRQLNLSSWEQRIAMQALSFTTHPSAFRMLFKSIDSSLRRQAHPNFVRWSICNGNPARVTFARGLGVGCIILGVAVGVLLTLSTIGRGYRALAAIGLVLGTSTLVAAWKGMCVVLHGMHHRHVRPWELFAQAAPEDAKKDSMDSFGSCNSYEDEPWLVKYDKRNVVRKVFDREVWIQEPALRRIQDIIFVQAILAGLLVGGVASVIFVLVPGGDLF